MKRLISDSSQDMSHRERMFWKCDAQVEIHLEIHVSQINV